MVLANAMAVFCPLISNWLFHFNFGIAHEERLESEVTTDSLEMLRPQIYLQLAQAGCFLYTFFVSMRFAKKSDPAKYLAACIFWTQTNIIPVLSIIHLAVSYEQFLDESNLLRAWLLTYPLIGLATIIQYW